MPNASYMLRMILGTETAATAVNNARKEKTHDAHILEEKKYSKLERYTKHGLSWVCVCKILNWVASLDKKGTLNKDLKKLEASTQINEKAQEEEETARLEEEASLEYFLNDKGSSMTEAD